MRAVYAAISDKKRANASGVLIIRSPFCHGVRDWPQRFPKSGQRILHPRRNLGIDGSRYDAVRLHFMQAVGQHLLADTLKVAAQFVESPRAGAQVADNKQFPLAPDQKNLESVAFCCISTGEFHFPNEMAAETAIQTVKNYKADTGSKIKVIFNVYKDRDYRIYRKLLG